MTRARFFGHVSDVSVVQGTGGVLNVAPLAVFNFYSAATGGTHYTDLLELDGSTAIVTYKPNLDSWLRPLYGPDTITQMWADDGASERFLVECWTSDMLALTGLVVTDAGTWAANTAYTAGALRYEPDLSRRIVALPYTSGSSYGATDTANSKLIHAPLLTQTVTDGLYGPISSAYNQVIAWDGSLLQAGFDLDVNGIDMIAAGQINQIQAELDLATVGADLILRVYRLVPGSNVETQIAYLRVSDGQVSGITSLVTVTHASSTTSGNSVITDASIALADLGKVVTGTGIPANSYVGAVTAGVSYILSSSPSASTAVNATASGSPTLSLGAPLTFAAKDKLAVRVQQVGTTFAGSGLKVRIALGTTTFATVTSPGAASTLVLASSSSNSVTISWTPGTNSSQSTVYKNGSPYWNVGTLSTFTDNGSDGVSGLIAGSSATYSVASRRYSAITSPVGSLVAGPTAQYNILPQANGALLNPPILTTSGTGATASVAANILTTASGTAGNNAVADRELLLFTGDTGLRSAWAEKGMFTLGTPGSIVERYYSSNIFNLSGTNATNYLQLVIGQFTYRCSYLSSTWNPATGGAGTGTTGTRQDLTDSAYPTNLATTRQAGGSVSFSSSLAVGTYYGYKISMGVIDGTGAQSIAFYFGTSAQYGSDGSGLPLVNTFTLTPAMRTGLPIGSVLTQQIGHLANTAGTSESTSWSALAITPVSPSGS